jgi:5'-nucleotidase/UDP-sugar diphosphatase
MGRLWTRLQGRESAASERNLDSPSHFSENAGVNNNVQASRTWIFVLGLNLILAGTACRKATVDLVILHSNDIHGTFQPHKILEGDTIRLVGGMEAASHHINRIRAQEENVLLLDTGDIMTGTLAASLPYRDARGGAMAEFLNLLGYDVRCYGNHEFDLGQANVHAIDRVSQSPVVMSNLVIEDSGELFAPQPYHILRRWGLRIGVIAVMEENFLTEVSPENVTGLQVLPMVPTLERWLPEIRKKCDLVIALVHSKFRDGIRIARRVSGLDLVLVASEDARFEDVNGVLVKSTRGHQRTLGYLKLTVQGKKIVSYQEDQVWLWADGDLNADPSVTDLIKQVEGSIEDEYKRVIGQSGFDYKCPGYNSIENSLGNWMTDVMRWKSQAQIGLINSGGIRADLYSGPITVRDLHEISPFANTLVVFPVRGRQLKRILEQDIDRGRDRFQVSGLRYTYYPRGSRPFGTRVDYLAVGSETIVRDGELLLPDAEFTAVSNDYVVGQARDKYFGFEVLEKQDTGISLTKALEEWLQQNRMLTCEIEDRIVELKPRRRR